LQNELEVLEDYKKKYADLVEKNNTLKKLHASCQRPNGPRRQRANQYINHIDDEHSSHIQYRFPNCPRVDELKKQYKPDGDADFGIFASTFSELLFVGHIKVPSAANHAKKFIARDPDDASGNNLTKHQNFTKHLPLNGGRVAIATEKITYYFGEEQQVGQQISQTTFRFYFFVLV